MDGKLYMTDKDKVKLRRKNLYTKEHLMEFFSTISLPDGVIRNSVEKDNYIEFLYDGTIYSVMVDGGIWDSVKEELLRQNQRKKIEDEKKYDLDEIDSLTKLYNKEYSRKIIAEFLKTSDENSHHALMIVDINNFATINENLGYLFGDTVLVNIADALRNNFYDTDIAARIGGDEFLIFIKNISDPKVLIEKAATINSVFQNTYTGENGDYLMSCSIGIATYPEDGLVFSQLFTKADAALIHTRESKNDFYSFFQSINEPQQYIDFYCYDKYKITKTRAYGSSKFDKEITAFAFDIMSRTKDVSSAIHLLLNKVRVQFNCDQICIMEYGNNATSCQLTYYCSKEGMKADAKIEEVYCKSLHLFDFNEEDIFYIHDTSEEKVRERKVLEELGIKSLLQCGIFENGIKKGFLSIHFTENKRLWSQYELDSFVTITKIISSYLLKMRASEKASRQLYQMKNFDGLTGLPTLHKFIKDVKELQVNNPNTTYALIYSDISQFKYINNTLGYEAGDEILCDYARFISSGEMNYEAVARVSEDNFVAIMRYSNKEEIMKLIIHGNEKFNLLQKAKHPGIKLVIVSGVSILQDEDDITLAVDNANIARKSIKNNPKLLCRFFERSMELELQWEAEVNNIMEEALKNGEFLVYLQPKIGLSNNELVGAEALVRWKKDGLMVPPNDFIPIFEKNGFIVNLDFYIYEEVCKILRTWLNENRKIVPISMNVSRIHLNDEDFVTNLKKLVDSYNIPYNFIELELTESIFVNHTEVALETMKTLRTMGFGVSIDDFGAGYSSLNLLKDMTTDVIKLDKEFFGKGDMQKEEQIILASIISMAKQLNMKVLSEGVETQSQSDFLKSVKCDMAQGYLYSKPIPVEEFEQFLFKNN